MISGYAYAMAGMGEYPGLPEVPAEDERFLDRIKKEAWLEVTSKLSFASWLSIREEDVAKRCVGVAWRLFQEALAGLAPERWVALVPMHAWVQLPIEERQQLGARLLVDTQAVAVEGAGTPPASIAEWAATR